MQSNIIPKDEREIVACIVTISEEMHRMKEDVMDCHKAIVDHAKESRNINSTIQSLQFSVESINGSVKDIQETLEKLNDFFNKIITIALFTKNFFKSILLIITIISISLGIMKLLGKL